MTLTGWAEYEPPSKFKVKDRVKIVRLIDERTSKEIIGKWGVVVSVGNTYDVKTDDGLTHCLNEKELELAP